MSESGEGGGPPKLERAKPATGPRGSYGLAAEVTAAAALAAGLAWQGALAQEGPLHLYYLAAAAQAGGRLDLDTERGRFVLHFKRGAVEHAASDAPEDDVGRFLVARGAVRPEAVADGERLRAEFGGDLVAALTNLRLLNPAESFRVLQEHGAAVVARALGAEKGTARWTPGAPLPASSFPLGSRWGMLSDTVRRLDGLAVRKLLGDRLQRVAARSGGRAELADLKLTALEARAAGLFDGRSSPAQLAARHPAEAETIVRLALLLGETELLRYGEVVAAAAPTPTPSARASTAPPAATGTATARPTATPTPRPAAAPAPLRSPPAPRAPAPQPTASPKPAAPRPAIVQDAGALQELYARVGAGDHFQALGVKREATTAQIKAAYFQLAKSYHPDAGPPGEPPELKKLRADIFARLGEAWGVLGDEAHRAEYLEQLASGGVGEVDVSAIFKAEETFQKAVVLVRTRQYDRALQALGEAIALNAEEPEFSVWKAWVEFLLAPDRKRQHAASSSAIEVALKTAPRCMPAYLFLGQMAKLAGDLALAERHLKRGLALDPDHAELARELKYLRK